MTNSRVWAAVILLAGGAAIAADLWDIGLEPVTILTLALVAATIYYALQNQDMAASLRAQLIEMGQADTSRQR